MDAAHITIGTLRQHLAYHLERAAGHPLLITRPQRAEHADSPACVLAHDTWRALTETLPPNTRPADTQLLDTYPGTTRDGVQCLTTRTARDALTAIVHTAERAGTAARHTGTPTREGHTIITRQRDTAPPVVVAPAVWVDMLTGDYAPPADTTPPPVVDAGAHELSEAWARTVAPTAEGTVVRVHRARYVTDAPYPAVVMPHDQWSTATRDGRDVPVQHRAVGQVRKRAGRVLDDAERRGVHTVVTRHDGFRVVVAPHAWWVEQ